MNKPPALRRGSAIGACLIVLGTLPGCATIIEGPVDTIEVRTAPIGASCTLQRGSEDLGAIASTPGSINVHRTDRDITVFCSKPGWQPVAYTVQAKFTGAIFSDILLLPAGGPIGVAAGAITDASTGASHAYGQQKIILMQPLPRGQTNSGYAPFTPAASARPVPAATPSTGPALAMR